MRVIAYITKRNRGKLHRWEGDDVVRSRCGLEAPAGSIGTATYPPREPTCIKCRYGVNPATRSKPHY